MADKGKMPLYEWIDEINKNQPSIWGHRAQMADTDRMKELIYENTYNRLVNIILKMYKWTLPDTLSARAIEMGFLYRGNVCIFKDGEIGGIYALPCIPQNTYNIYGDPTQVNVFGMNGYTKLVNIEYLDNIPALVTEGVVSETAAIGVFARDNDLSYPYIRYVEEYAAKIADKVLALNIATQKLKSPFRYAISEIDLKDTVQAMISKIQSNDDTVILVKGNKLEDRKITDIIQPLESKIEPSVIDAIKNSIVFDFNMFLETIGLNTNPSPDKSQVVLTPELDSNNSVIDIESDVRFINRQNLCDVAKKVLGIEISVEKNVDEKMLEQEQNKLIGGAADDDEANKESN